MKSARDGRSARRGTLSQTDCARSTHTYVIDFKGGLEKYIEAEVQRRVEERLAKVLRELGVSRAGLRRRGGGRTRASVTEAPASTPPKKPRQPVSAATRAKMKAAWARRKADREANRAAGNADASPSGT